MSGLKKKSIRNPLQADTEGGRRLDGGDFFFSGGGGESFIILGLGGEGRRLLYCISVRRCFIASFVETDEQRRTK